MKMMEQELKPGSRQGRTLRETERRRVLRNRILGTGVVLSIAAALITGIRRALPQWIEMPGNTAGNTAQEKSIPPTSANRNTLSATSSIRGSTPGTRPLRTSTVKTAPKTKTVRRALVPSGLGPEILPVEASEVPHRRKRRRRSIPPVTPQVTAKQPDAAPPKHALSDAPVNKSTTSTPAQPNSKPPDDVPDNP